MENQNPQPKPSIKWNHYLMEFLMLFLAISLGFFADNYRDQLSERAKEKEYILSLIEDVTNDKLNIQTAIHNNQQRQKYLDTLSQLCLNYQSSNHTNFNIYKLYSIVVIRPDFISPTQVTMQQLKSAGAMRLIKNKKAIDEIIRYDLSEKKLSNQQMYYENYQMNSINLGSKILNLEKVVFIAKNPNTTPNSNQFLLINNNPQLISEFGNNLFMYSGIVNYYTHLLQQMHIQANKLIETLKTEYKIK